MLTELSTGQIDVSTTTPLRLPALQGGEGDSYILGLEVTASTEAISNLFFTVVAVYDTTSGEIEGSLLTKFFPKGRVHIFAVAVPKSDMFKDRNIIIELEAKRRFRGPATGGLVTVRLTRDEDIKDLDQSALI